jgi:hypothetical protein
MGNSTIPTVKRPNECDVITIFPMGVECFVINPSSSKAFDGAATLLITGGTPPYTILWEVGSYAPALANLGVGEYSATVIDYYGDFTANTTCVLTAETLTLSGMCFVLTGIVEDQLVYVSTESLGLKNGKPYYEINFGTDFYGYVYWNPPTNQWIFCQTLECQNYEYSYLDSTSFYPSGTTGSWISSVDIPSIIQESYVGSCVIPTTPKELYDLCVSLEVREGGVGKVTTIETINIDLSPGDTINGEPSWTSSTSQYLLYWNTNSTPNQWTLTGYSPTTTFVNNDPSYPPLSNWQILGNPSVIGITVLEGNCSTEYSIFVDATKNDAICNSKGSITVTASGGVAPYMYTIDGGQTYQSSPIFNNLNPGTYFVMAKDANNATSTYGNITINTVPPVNYTLTLSVDYNNNTFTMTAPTLPQGVTLQVDLVMSSVFTYYPIGILPQPTFNNVTTVQGTGVMPLVTVNQNTIPVSGPCTINNPINALQTQKIYQSTLTLTSDQTITGSTTNIIINDPIGGCRDSIGFYTINIINPNINGCTCCHLDLINPVPPVPPTI